MRQPAIVELSPRQQQFYPDEEWFSARLTPDELDLLDVDEDLVAMTNQSEPCPECGEFGHCGTDNIGRPLYHHPREEDQD